MNEHVYARLVGYGLAIVPRAPFTLERLGPSDLPIRVTHGQTSAVLATPSHGPSDLSNVADVAPGPTDDFWSIETSPFEAVWPQGFTVHHDPSGPPGFYLQSAAQALVFAQGPYPQAKIPALERMAAPGQALCQVHITGLVQWVHLSYSIGAVPWVQRHHVVPLGSEYRVIVTFQAPEAVSAPALIAAGPFITSIAAPRGAA